MRKYIRDGILLAALENRFLAVFLIEKAVLGAHSGARGIEHDIDLLHKVFERAGNRDARFVEFLALVGCGKKELVGHALLAQRAHRKRHRHIRYADKLHVALQSHTICQSLTNDAISCYANFHFRHKNLLLNPRLFLYILP